MSQDLNLVVVIGRLVREPEIKYTASSTQITSFSIANNQDYSDKKQCYFFEVTCFGKLAEVTGKYLKKGSRISVEGMLKQDIWEKDGKKNSKVSILANKINFLDAINSNDQSSNSQISGSSKEQDSKPDQNDPYNMSENFVNDDIPF